MSLIINNLSKRYNENLVIKDVSLEIHRGEILGIFGAIGEGKSALMRTIAGVEECNGGLISFDTVELTENSGKKRDIYFPNITNESFWKSVFKTNKNSEIADGEGQVLALEDALQQAQNVLLLDNQFCYMDRRTREKMCEKLREEVKNKNLAVIFATNDYDEVFSICDRVAVLHKGEICQTGTPREVYEKPVSSLVASITGRNNLIAARLMTSNESDLLEFQTGKGEHRLFTDKFDITLLGATNQNITLAIRPEHVSISFGASFPEDNLIKAKITNIIFRGAMTLIKLDAEGLELEALVLRLVGLNIGDECMVGLPPDRILVLKD
ncbi:MAG: ABC transporter ATP-binding protein [Acidobacteria bacterium]|nr:ABC transporter ATP-binding protein [Acidobacteriota bacterium]MCA1637341.1 ABC transporter ATP-binding protein [Acidobacteriota bacterium]